MADKIKLFAEDLLLLFFALMYSLTSLWFNEEQIVEFLQKNSKLLTER